MISLPPPFVEIPATERRSGVYVLMSLGEARLAEKAALDAEIALIEGRAS